MGRPLPDQTREKFAAEYVKALSVAKAAKAAGISERTGWNWMQEQGMEERIAALAAESTSLALVDAAQVIQELARIALADPLEAFKEDGTLRDLADIPPALRRTIASLETEEIISAGIKIGEVKKIKFWDKTRGLEMLARHFALFKDSLTINDGKGELDESAVAARAASIIDTLRERARKAADAKDIV